MSSSITVLTGTETFAKRSTARAGVGQETEQSEIVRTEGEERHGVDGLLCHRCSPGGEVVNPLSWDDADSGALFCPDVGRSCEPCPTVIIGFMVEVVNPLSWDDADSGALTIDVVDWTCDRRSALMAGLIIGLMVGVMNPLGWAFTGPLILDPSVRWLTRSPTREAPGWAFVGWLMQRTGSVWRHMEEQPGPFGEKGRGARSEPVTHDTAANRAGTTSPASSSTPTRCRAVSLLSITWSMAGGAPFVPPGPPSSAGSRPPTPVPAVKGRPEAERGHQGRPRRRRAGDLRGRAVFRSGP
jgi:hypothetical protein